MPMFKLLPLVILIAGLVYLFVRSRRGTRLPAKAVQAPFVPDARNDKVILVRGWTETELERIIKDFTKMYDIAPNFNVREIPGRDSTLEMTFPEDIAADQFMYLVNYLNYPITVEANSRSIGVLGKVTLTPAFKVPDPTLLGAQAFVNVPANDHEYDLVHIRLPSGRAFRWSFSDDNWQSLAEAQVPDAIVGL